MRHVHYCQNPQVEESVKQQEDKVTKTAGLGGKNREFSQSGDPDVSLGLIIYFRVLPGHLILWPLPHVLLGAEDRDGCKTRVSF